MPNQHIFGQRVGRGAGPGTSGQLSARAVSAAGAGRIHCDTANPQNSLSLDDFSKPKSIEFQIQVTSRWIDSQISQSQDQRALLHFEWFARET